MRTYSQLPMKVLIIEFKFLKYFLGLAVFLCFISSNFLYAHSTSVNPFPKLTEIDLNLMEKASSKDSILFVQNAFFYTKDSVFINQEPFVISDTFQQEKSKATIYIASGTTVIHADEFQNVNLVYLEESIPVKKVSKKQKNTITKKIKKETVAKMEKKSKGKPLLFTHSKSKEYFSSFLGNDLAILLISKSTKIHKLIVDLLFQFSTQRKRSIASYNQPLKSEKIQSKSKERAPPSIISVLV